MLLDSPDGTGGLLFQTTLINDLVSQLEDKVGKQALYIRESDRQAEEVLRGEAYWYQQLQYVSSYHHAYSYHQSVEAVARDQKHYQSDEYHHRMIEDLEEQILYLQKENAELKEMRQKLPAAVQCTDESCYLDNKLGECIGQWEKTDTLLVNSFFSPEARSSMTSIETHDVARQTEPKASPDTVTSSSSPSVHS